MDDWLVKIFWVVVYWVLPMWLIIFGIRRYQKWKHGKLIQFQHIPKLTVAHHNLSDDVVDKIHLIDQKAKQILVNYQNDPSLMLSENQFIIQKILTDHLPKAINDYQTLDPQRANQQVIDHHQQTAKQALINFLDEIDYQFDGILAAIHQKNSEQLLINQRYLRSRFSNIKF